MEKTIFPYGLVYGPHASRRLGLSMGVDLTPMTCTFNCVYCERGVTLFGCRDHRDFNPKVNLKVFLDLLKQKVKAVRKFDCLTFSGTGEPTIDLQLGEFIASARKIVGSIPIKVITNSSQTTKDIVIKNLSEADEVIAKLNAISDNTFTNMHRPFENTLNTERIIRSLHTLKEEIESRLTIEILFIRSYQPIKTNSTHEEVKKLTEVLRQLEPGKIQIHTVSRMVAEPYILPVSRKFLATASTYMKNILTKTKVSTYI
jgi:wyosine [tRNA(Phe)-imidazoG37] synthetase (radical SAM superfamily)